MVRAEMASDVIHMILNVALPPGALSFLLFMLPAIVFVRILHWATTAVLVENMNGKVVLITGASSGIGEQIAYEYAKRGARLVLVARREKELRNVAYEAIDLGAVEVHVVAGDLSQEEVARKSVRAAIERFGRLDHLVNNAGLAHSFLFEEANSTKVFNPVVDSSFWHAVYMTYYALPHLRESKGRIVVIASLGAWLPVPRMSVYNAAKAAEFQFFESLRVEVSPEVGITNVTPGMVESEMTKGKYVSPEGELTVKRELRDIQGGPVPFAPADYSAEVIVSAAVRRRRYVVVPKWYSIFYIYHIVAPEVVDWMSRLVFVADADHKLVAAKSLKQAISSHRSLYAKGAD